MLSRKIYLLGIVFMITACSNKMDIEDMELIRKTGPGPAGGGGLSSQTLDMGRKLSPYIRCINGPSKTLLRTMKSYFRWADRLKGPTCKERSLRAPSKLYSTYACTSAIRVANLQKPHLPQLEKAASDYSKAMTAIKPILDQAYSYYQFRQYRSDGCQKGKQLHRQLVEQWKKANIADQIVLTRVAFHNKKVQEERLAQVERQFGKKHPRYLRRKGLALAREAIAKVKYIGTKGLADYEASVNAFRAIVVEMDKAKTTGVRMWFSLKLAAKKLLKAFDEITDRKRSKKRFTSTEIRWIKKGRATWVKGTYEKANEALGKFVDAYNNVKFR